MSEMSFPLIEDSTLDQGEQLLKEFVRVVRDTFRLVVCTTAALRRQTASIPMFEALHKFDLSQGRPTDEKRLEEERAEAAFIKQEIERGYPFLYSQTTIAIWGQLEAFVEDLAVFYLSLRGDEVLKIDTIARIKVPIGQLINLPDSDKYRFIVESIQRDSATNLSRGINQFEMLFDRIQLGGGIDEAVKKWLFELSAVRNVIVHRRGFADKRVIQECPWLQLSIGSPVQVTLKHLTRYAFAAMYYGCSVFRRVLQAFVKPTDWLDDYIANLFQNITELSNLENKAAIEES